MSNTRQYPIRCPKCGHEQSVTLYDSINIKDDPQLKQHLLANKLNAVQCPQCAFSFVVDKPLLYHDPERRIMIYLLPTRDPTNVAAAEKQFRDVLDSLRHLTPEIGATLEIHLVLSRSELVERIFLLEAQLDPRIIEYIKYLIYTRNLKKLEPREKILLFDAQDSDRENLCFVVQDAHSRRLEGILHYSRSAYAALDEMFLKAESGTKRLYELFPGLYVSARALLMDEGKKDSIAGNDAPLPT